MSRDYSQFGEQEAILAWAGEQEGAGSFVDVGAYDGVTYSNTAALAERGWQGLCIEAAPDRAAICAQHYAENELVTVLSAALTVAAPKLQPLYWTPGAPYSSLRYERARLGGALIVPILVPCLHPSELVGIWRALPEPVFCSLDAEGESLALWPVLRDWLAPALVCLEAAGEEQEQALELLEGWHVRLRTEVNIVAARS